MARSRSAATSDGLRHAGNGSDVARPPRKELDPRRLRARHRPQEKNYPLSGEII